MCGEEIKRHLADACREAGYVVLCHADGRHGPAEGMPDLRIIGPWANRQTCLDLECKSARERLRPAQQRYADAACQVAGDGYVYAVVRQTPEAPGELAARTVAFMLGLPDLARRMPAPGPGAVYGERDWRPSPIGENAGGDDFGDVLVNGLPLRQHPEPGRSRVMAALREAAKGGAR